MSGQTPAMLDADHIDMLPLIEFALAPNNEENLLNIMDLRPLAPGALDDVVVAQDPAWADEDDQFLRDFERSLEADRELMIICGDFPAPVVADRVPSFGAVVSGRGKIAAGAGTQLLVQDYHFIDGDAIDALATMQSANAVCHKINSILENRYGSSQIDIVFLGRGRSVQSVALTIHPAEHLADDTVCHPFTIDDISALTETLGTDTICFAPLPAAANVLFACAAGAIDPALLFALGVRADKTGMVGVTGILNVHDGIMDPGDRAFFLDMGTPVVVKDHGAGAQLQEVAPPPQGMAIDDGVFQVEKILDEKMLDGERHVFIKWAGFPMSSASWEPASNIIAGAASDDVTICGVDGILKAADFDGVTMYLVKWSGFSLEDASWELRENALEEDEDA